MQQQISTEKYIEITNFKNKAGGIFSFVSYPMSIEVNPPPPTKCYSLEGKHRQIQSWTSNLLVKETETGVGADWLRDLMMLVRDSLMEGKVLSTEAIEAQ